MNNTKQVKILDYRSDTVTKPTAQMREAMMSATVGDDVFGEDPTVNALEEKTAFLFGKEAALFCSSGTQTNQIAINVHVQPGGEVICHEDAHIYKYEGGGIAKNSGASVKLLQGNYGRITAHDAQSAINNPSDIHLPLTQLIALEDTANRGGGAIYDFDEIKKLRSLCDLTNLPLHLDGARMMNALVKSTVDYKEYAVQFDSISLCLSKGLGAPVGSLLIGSKSFIAKARRVRKVMGGGMRQAGFLAAAGIYALDHHVVRLAEDHLKAEMIANCLVELPFVRTIFPVETNIVIFELQPEIVVDEFIFELKLKGILVSAFGKQLVRIVTHLDISMDDVEDTCLLLKTLKLN